MFKSIGKKGKNAMNTRERLYVDVHVLQTLPPSCINRDDTGSPKTAIYGGAMRARVSSQSWKHAMRLYFKETFPKEMLGARTKKIDDMVADEIRLLGNVADPEAAAKKILVNAGLKIKADEKGTDALFFMSYAQAKALAKLVDEDVEAISDKPSKEVKERITNAIKNNPGIDVALFGRMVAQDPSLNTDACSQVAHSISTHRVSNEYDYFTAVDDLASENNAGAGHIGTVEFNSATLYRYATINVQELNHQLTVDTELTVREFVKSFICSLPTGKQNTFANRTLPDCVLVTVRTDQPINLVGAFEKPVSSSEEGYVFASASKLSDYAEKVYSSFANRPVASFVVGEPLRDMGDILSLDKMLDELGSAIHSILNAGNNQ